MTTGAAEPGIVAALVTCIGLLGTVLVFVIRTFTQARAANQAVNNVGPGEHSLWDQVTFIREDIVKLVAAQEDFTRRGWQTLPDDIGTAARLTEKIRQLEHADAQSAAAHQRISKQLEVLTVKLSEHDEWERSHKYQS